MIKKLFITVLFIALSFSVNAQFQEKIVPPSMGKTVIYFLRTSSAGSLMNIRYFDSEKYLGKFNGRSYIRYECEPGEHVFWIKAENIDVLKADLQEGKVYFIETNAVMGAFSAGAKFQFIQLDNQRKLKRINKLFEKKTESVFSEEELKNGAYENRFVIKRGLEKVEKKLKKTKKHKVLSSDMFVDFE